MSTVSFNSLKGCCFAQEVPGWNLQLAPHTGKQDERRRPTISDCEVAVLTRELTRFVFGTARQLLHLPARSSHVDTQNFSGFSHVYCPGGLSNMELSRGSDLEQAPAVNMERNRSSKDRGGVRSLGGGIQRAGRLCPLDDQLQQGVLKLKILRILYYTFLNKLSVNYTINVCQIRFPSV